MHTILPVARIFGLGAPESIVVLVILMVFFAGYVKSIGNEGGVRRGADSRLTPHEKRILIVVGAVVAVCVGVLVWQWIAK